MQVNRRTDAYGGSARKRLALLFRIVDGIRAECPQSDGFCLGVKLNCSDFVVSRRALTLLAFATARRVADIGRAVPRDTERRADSASLSLDSQTAGPADADSPARRSKTRSIMSSGLPSTAE